MKYREFGKSGKKVSLLGFGCMRLPVLNRDPKEINEPLAFKMIRKAIDCGVNYIDTAWGYHGGMSEPFLGNKSLKTDTERRYSWLQRCLSGLLKPMMTWKNIFNSSS